MANEVKGCVIGFSATLWSAAVPADLGSVPNREREQHSNTLPQSARLLGFGAT